MSIEPATADIELIKLSGDGKHDDAPAIQAFLDGRVVSFSDGRPLKLQGGYVVVAEPGEYLARRRP